jgi:hypothetical protein
MAMGILNNMARKLNGFFLEEAPCGSTGLLHEQNKAALMPKDFLEKLSPYREDKDPWEG